MQASAKRRIETLIKLTHEMGVKVHELMEGQEGGMTVEEYNGGLRASKSIRSLTQTLESFASTPIRPPMPVGEYSSAEPGSER